MSALNFPSTTVVVTEAMFHKSFLDAYREAVFRVPNKYSSDPWLQEVLILFMPSYIASKSNPTGGYADLESCIKVWMLLLDSDFASVKTQAC